jgi:hypothetical protein
MSTDHDDRTPGQKILEEIAAIPAILVFRDQRKRFVPVGSTP